MTSYYTNYGQILHRNLIEIFELEMSFYELKPYLLNPNDTSLLEVFIIYNKSIQPDWDDEKFVMKDMKHVYIKINKEVIYSHNYIEDYYSKMIVLLHEMTYITKSMLNKNELENIDYGRSPNNYGAIEDIIYLKEE